MSVSHQLIKKMITINPELKEYLVEGIVRVYGYSDSFKWSNFGANTTYIFSYETMKDCLEKEIEIRFRHGFGNSPHGWEVCLKD